jgi:uncharacterized membrane protein YkvA (DUF1232 family)
LLRASSVEIFLSSTDLRQVLEEYAAGRVENLQVQLEEGAVIIRHRVVSERLPMAVPVELRLKVREVRGTEVEAGVTWSNMPLLPGFLKELALQKAFESLPGDYANGVLAVDVADVLESLPVSFRIDAVAVNPEGIRVRLTDVIAFPFEPAAVITAEAGALVPVPSRTEQDLPEHQDYYHKLRERVKRFAAEKAPAWVQPLVPWVLAVPDFFVLMVRLARDERVPPMVKVIAGAVIAYIISPVDLIPDLIPVVGEVDDVAVALFAIQEIAQRVPSELVQEHWPGEGRVLDLAKEGIQLFKRVLPDKMIAAIRRLVTRN